MNKTLFAQYKEANVQLGVSDLFEIQTLQSGQDLSTIFYHAQVGINDNFNWHDVRDQLTAALQQAFGPNARAIAHEASSKTSHDIYFYFQVTDKPVDMHKEMKIYDRIKTLFTRKPVEEILELGISLMNVAVDNTRGTLICPTEVKEILDPIFRKVIADDHHPVYILSLNADGGVSETRRSIRISAEQFGITEFYPWLKKRGVTLEEYIDIFYRSNTGMVLFIGNPGTGKSTLIRTAIRQTGLPGYLVYDPKSIQATSVLDHFYSSNGGILGIEDADNFLKKRSEGNTELSSYLNYTDGVVKDTTKKVILSTNLSSVSKVDEALLREGRCFEIPEFGPLTLDEAYLARDAAKMPYIQFDEVKYKDGIMLADALKAQPFGQTVEEAPRGFQLGFGN